MDIVLVAGLWLPSTVWDAVAGELDRRGHRPHVVKLPGADDGNVDATLDDQLDAVVAAVDGTVDECVVVGHSAASTLAWLVADRRPTRLAAAVMIGGFPAADETPYATFFDLVDGVMPFPGWEPFEGPDADDLDADARERIAASTVAVPGGVAHGVVRYGDERRAGVPVVLVCPEFDPDQAREWIEGGDVVELHRAHHVSYVDIDSGHWPMVTRPSDLAAIIARVAESARS